MQLDKPFCYRNYAKQLYHVNKTYFREETNHVCKWTDIGKTNMFTYVSSGSI